MSLLRSQAASPGSPLLAKFQHGFRRCPQSESSPAIIVDFVTKALWPGTGWSTTFDRVVGIYGAAGSEQGSHSRGESLNQLEKTTEAGFVVLIAIATQTREGRTGEPTDTELVAARLLFNKSFRKTAS